MSLTPEFKARMARLRQEARARDDAWAQYAFTNAGGNLGELLLDDADDNPLIRCQRPRHKARSQEVEAVFDDLPGECARFIHGSSAVTGCVAWLTSYAVLDALATVPEVQIVVQKEDFLRPDAMQMTRPQLKSRYDALRVPSMWKYGSGIGGVGHMYSTASQTEIDCAPVTCMGIVTRDGQKRAVPRMHHKFLVRWEPTGEWWHADPVLAPAAVWTGSFNMTYNGAASLENAVIIRNPDIAFRYALEWNWVFGMSEPLDWESDWVCPVARLGT